jgi:hippurate hydrolase
VGKFNAGTATNVIPDTAQIEGTVRTLGQPTRDLAKAAVHRRCYGIATANRCTVDFQWIEGYPATVNDPAMADFVAATARKTFGEKRFFPITRPFMGGEDFAYYLEKVPGCFFLVGVEPPGAKNHPSLHTDRYDFTDAAMAIGMRMFIALVQGFGQ